MVISATKNDVIWGYIGVVINYCGSLLLIPFLTFFLPSDDLGLWYIFLAVSNLAQLFELGFNPAFSRNITYCLSGARSLSSKQRIVAFDEKVDWHLYRVLTIASRALYACISIVVLIGLIVVGTPYISFVTNGFSKPSYVLAWIIFAGSIFLNLYYLYALSNLIGLGDVAGENRAKSFAGLMKLVVTILLLFAGFGLIAAAVGYLVQGISLRFAAIKCIRQHDDISEGIASDKSDVTLPEIRGVIRDIAPIAWRTGVEQISLFASSQGASLISSLNLSLADTARYSLGLQIANAIATVSYAFIRTYYPSYQSSYASGDIGRQREIVKRGLPMYWICEIILSIGVALIGLPVLSYARPSSVPPLGLFVFISVYVALLNHHSVFCNLILSTNRIPFLRSFVISSAAGVIFAALLSFEGVLGVYGLVLGQMIPQLVYNNWKWPLFVMKELNLSYFEMLGQGMRYWSNAIRSLF